MLFLSASAVKAVYRTLDCSGQAIVMAQNGWASRCLHKFCVSWIDLYFRFERSVGPTEVITRFLRHKGDYRTDPRVEAKERAFLPRRPAEGAPRAISTFLTGRLTAKDVWRLGKHKLASAGLKGRADLRADQITRIGLELSADSRFFRHVDIIGWADHKAEQKLQAQKLARASNAILVRPPRPANAERSE